MKIDRLIGILIILLQQEQTTAPELAARFEVSRRTVNRDVEDLCKAGIPIVTTQGYGGGISIAEGFKMDQSLLTGEEVQTLLAAVKGIESVSNTSQLTTVSEKLLRRDRRTAVDEVLLIDLAAHDPTGLAEKVETIKRAIIEQREICFTYIVEKGEQRRRIEPYRLVFKWSSWYVFGYCLDRNAFRLFKLSRLWGLERTHKFFAGRKIPKKELQFNDYLQTKNFHLKARFAQSVKHRLIEEYGIGCYTVKENGELLFEKDFAGYENMREWIFSFGDRVTVLEPQCLAEDRRRQARAILEQDDGKISATNPHE